MKMCLGLVCALMLSTAAKADVTYTESTEIYTVLMGNPEIAAVPVAAQLAFGKAVLVTSVTLMKTNDQCSKRAKVTFIQAGQGSRPRSQDSMQEINLKDCAVE